MLRTPLLHLGVAALAMAEAVSKEQKKRSEAVGRASHSTAVGCFWGRSPCMEILARTDSNLSTVQLPKWEALCMANEPEGEPSELGRTTCHSLPSKRLLAFFRVHSIHADMCRLHMPHALNRRWRSTSIVIDCFLWAQAKPHDQSVLAASRGVCWMADT